MQKTLTFCFCLFMTGSFLKAQSFRTVYEFTSAAVCPNTSLGITAPATFMTFSDFTGNNVNCSPTTDVFNHSGWNITAIVDTSEYIQYTITADDCYRLDLDTVIFTFRNSAVGNTPTYHIRTSLDNYASDVFSGGSTNALDTDTLVFDPITFSSTQSLTIRLYITNMLNNGNTFRVDDVTTIGSAVYFGNLAFYLDPDGDGYGSGTPVPMCSNPGGYSLLDGDCDETNPLINPATVWYADIDGDGFGDPGATETGCSSTLTNATLDGTDCNDTDANLSPNTVWYLDADLDGFGDDNQMETGCTTTFVNSSHTAGDCNDSDANINPNTVWYEDQDNDGFGNDQVSETACTSSFANATLTAGDCNDNNPNSYLGAIEICDGEDNNCDGDIDEDLPTTEYFIDNDGDGYGSGSAGLFCSDPGVGYTLDNTDCNDDDAAINPGATEILGNEIDEDCNGSLVGLDDLSAADFKIYPNPAKNHLMLSGDVLKDKTITIQIIDASGKLVLSEEFTADQLIKQINLDQCEKGWYVLQVQSGQAIIHQSFVKE